MNIFDNRRDREDGDTGSNPLLFFLSVLDSLYSGIAADLSQHLNQLFFETQKIRCPSFAYTGGLGDTQDPSALMSVVNAPG